MYIFQDFNWEIDNWTVDIIALDDLFWERGFQLRKAF